MILLRAKLALHLAYAIKDYKGLEVKAPSCFTSVLEASSQFHDVGMFRQIEGYFGILYTGLCFSHRIIMNMVVGKRTTAVQPGTLLAEL